MWRVNFFDVVLCVLQPMCGGGVVVVVVAPMEKHSLLVNAITVGQRCSNNCCNNLWASFFVLCGDEIAQGFLIPCLDCETVRFLGLGCFSVCVGMGQAWRLCWMGMGQTLNLI